MDTKTSDDSGVIPEPYRSLHKLSSLHREQILASKFVGCFHCYMICAPRVIKQWIDEGQTALCPLCGIDSVIPITEEQMGTDILEKMNEYWFATGPVA